MSSQIKLYLYSTLQVQHKVLRNIKLKENTKNPRNIKTEQICKLNMFTTDKQINLLVAH